MWFRNDLRLADNPALHWAVETGRPVVVLFVLDENGTGRALGGAAKWWLHHSLAAHHRALRDIGIRLVLKRGCSLTVVCEIVAESGAECVVWNRRYDAPEIALDKAIKSTLAQDGIEARSFNGSLLVEPWRMQTKSGTPFRVFTAFWKSLAAGLDVPAPLPAPTSVAPAPDSIASLDLADFDILPRRDWARRFPEFWAPGEIGARSRLDAFLDRGLTDYETARDVPSRSATSGLSPHLRFGEISPAQIWRAVRMRRDAADLSDGGAAKFLSEIAWREFAYHLLYYNPDLARQNYAKSFDAIPWRRDALLFAAWKAGKTGYPIVDAGMLELRQTGWMHNRARMIAASFLVKHLLIDW